MIKLIKMDLNEIIASVTKKYNWTSESRIVGEACEEYVMNNIQCARCNNNNFEKCKINEKSKDLICKNCNQKYQIKAKSATQKEINNITTTKTFKTIGGEYSTTINNINENIDYLIILYEKHSYKIKSILYIKSDNININCIMPRKPLSLTAKRAGWQGCNLLFNNIEILM